MARTIREGNAGAWDRPYTLAEGETTYARAALAAFFAPRTIPVATPAAPLGRALNESGKVAPMYAVRNKGARGKVHGVFATPEAAEAFMYRTHVVGENEEGEDVFGPVFPACHLYMEIARI
jgi:hypothetical protein